MAINPVSSKPVLSLSITAARMQEPNKSYSAGAFLTGFPRGGLASGDFFFFFFFFFFFSAFPPATTNLLRDGLRQQRYEKAVLVNMMSMKACPLLFFFHA